MESNRGKTALVTGASKGLGKAIALSLLDTGAHVIAVARPSDELNALAEKMGPGGTILAIDATHDALLNAIENLERLDILVNNLGINRPQPMIQTSDDDLDLMLDVNVRSTYRIAQAGARKMVAQGTSGSIINITSQMGHVGSPGRTLYCMTKHAIEGLTKAMAVELAPNNIRVNSVAPTFIETPMTQPMLADPKFAEFVKSMIPLGRIGKPEDVAAAVTYLCSEGAGMVTGHSLLVDGGWTAQ